ncbi:carbon-nitrogen hydrolase family protein [Pseudomonas capsici]|uniref:Carbon-nitrogen hydrolase family protein n=1 Tax=Pseudomonas capsici TaxID=2810614 RepID=A0ABT3BRH1_9PSED|nr:MULTISPECIES: carbon-nitrogen hydrolase family protein [Pseudomonas]MBN6712822.1 carbon-nitrogen hydrolase family protein [Pseudomonas capsici]MBN6717441.1 carbon-nitrogen hydrolase family protein [Pseudomonas capsici]MBN6723508.1 carbon-nitrogen hydrolase family protein [Pseudomonas capsici]MBX8477828.1 carbon-nitrogen hydrolase family protein [Pseudomonas cichorii]MBX8613677.1 carbon-nitrogen hydrolase family protein [Pseudomonas cichorii]
MSRSIVAALQIGALPGGKADTLDLILSYEQAIIDSGARVVVMPEALLGGYPKGETFGTQLGYRLPQGREAFARYFENAIDVPGDETRVLEQLSARTGASLVLGVIERSGSSLYCTVLLFEPEGGLVARHRKLMPTGTERLIWGKGDGSTLSVVPSRAGRLGTAVCWENHMPLLRTAMYAKGVEIWCAPTVDEREIWQCSMRHIAHEGRMFVISACQVQPSPQALGIDVANWPAERPLINGGSVIVGPMGDVLAGPLIAEAGLLVAEIDVDELVKARYDFDVVGHYSRPDVFELVVDERSKPGVRFITD